MRLGTLLFRAFGLRESSKRCSQLSQVSSWLPIEAEFVILAASILAFPARSRTAAFTSRSHQSITVHSFHALANKFFRISTLNRPMLRALDRLVDANAAVDGDQFHSALHFDGESFPEGQARLIALRSQVVDRLAARDVQGARDTLGQALHTLQDFYAHSNWVELGNSAPNPNLGRPGRTLNRLSRATPTCNGSNVVTTELTSGYYGGQDREITSGKCRHGGPLDRSPGSGGINKDTRLNWFSPHSNHHDAAANLALQATCQFIREIKEIITPEQLRHLFGVSGPYICA
jgi:hypothetical protein